MAKEKEAKDLDKPIVLVDGEEQWDFDTNDTFIGRYTGREHIVMEDDGKTPKQDEDGRDLNLGWVFEQEDSEDSFIIGHWSSVDKAMKMEHDGKQMTELKPKMRFTHLGKKEHKGKPFRQFKVEILAF